MKDSSKVGKTAVEIIIFAVTMGMAFYVIFQGQDLSDIVHVSNQIPVVYLIESGMTAIFFVSTEGIMIYYLLHSLSGKSGLLRCISYSFIGFFYSAITPSATGGQPMQLYYMKKDRNSLADSSVVLMIVALIYKFVLVVIGLFLIIFWNKPLRQYLQNYFSLYLFGLGLNIILVIFLFEIMAVPDVMKRIFAKAEAVLAKMKLIKTSQKSIKAVEFIDNYHEAVLYLRNNKKKILFVIGLTFLQRCSVFFLTYIIYRGFGLKGTDLYTIAALQASIYIAVDMLPIPGAQGITELMYKNVFYSIFSKEYLVPSLYITRGINFYFLLIVSIFVVLVNWIYRKNKSSDG